ncbi:MAG TPA: hypothetical protein VF587_03970 [Solirubrobacteraceae bacterium]
MTVQQIQSFKREQGLAPEGEETEAAAAGVDFDDEIDLRAEDDAAIAAELDAAEKARAEAEEAAAEEGPDDEDDEEPKPRRRRSRRGGRSRRGAANGAIEATFDHGEEGYGLWLDPAVADNPVYAEHWAGHRPVEVTIEEDKIVIRRAGASADDDD